MAARKRVDPLKAKEAKQKKIAIGGIVILCLLVAVQGPKTLKMLKGPQTAPVAAPAPASPATPVPAGSDEPAPAADVVVDLTSLADSDVAPMAEDGQLVSFERFTSKDPFIPQAVVTPAPASDDEADAGDEAPDEGSDPVDGGFTPGSEGSEGSEGSGGSAGGGTAAPAAPTAATVTSISVNGTAEDVELKKSFPGTLPTFVLVSLAKDGKSVQIGIAGGSYANGGQTIQLRLGKPLTLQNTADGTRYELELLAVAGFVPPKRTP